MTLIFEDRTVLLTGVTSGIGLSTLYRLHEAGARVMGVGRNSDKLSALSRELGPRFEPLAFDLADPAARRGLTERVAALPHGPHVLINNAAECVFESPAQLDGSSLVRLFEINVFACVELAKAAAGVMTDGGHIVQLSSVTAKHMPDPRFASYGVTKASIAGLMDALRVELQPRGIAVSSVVPGLVDTPIYDKVSGFERVGTKLKQVIPRWLSPDDVAETILWVLKQPPHVVLSEVTILPKGQAR